MEMEKIATEKESSREDEGKGDPMLEVKTEEEAQPDHYSKLQKPGEDVYAEAYFGDSPAKIKEADKPTEGNARLYRAGCLILTIICIVLLLLVLVLAVKLQSGSDVCQETEETAADKQNPSSAPTCNYEQCEAHFTSTDPQRPGCQQCPNGWLRFRQWCFYLSTVRMNWAQSQRNCTASRGSLAVITSPIVQRFLTEKGNLKYWIGLRRTGNNWSWVSNSTLEKSYWEDGVSTGDCGLLSSGVPPEKNWIRAHCDAFSYFICQLLL